MHAGPTPFFSSASCRERQCRKLTFFLRSCDDSSEAFPSTSSKPADIRSPTQESKQTSQESASASKKQALNRHQLKMFQFTMDGSKLEDSESSASPTEFCSRCERQNFNQISAGLFLKNHCQCVLHHVWSTTFFFKDIVSAAHKF